MNAPAAIGHNGFDPIDEALAPFGDVISEAENWLDGQKVETEADALAAAKAFLAMGAKNALITLGEKGAFLHGEAGTALAETLTCLATLALAPVRATGAGGAGRQ